MLFDEGLHLRLREGVHRLGQLEAVLGAPVLNELVGPEALVALPAVHQGIGEAAEHGRWPPTPRGSSGWRRPGPRCRDSPGRTSSTRPLDVVFQLHAQRAVVPGVGQAAVDLAAGVDKAPALAQGHDLSMVFSVLFIVLSPSIRNLFLAQNAEKPVFTNGL